MVFLLVILAGMFLVSLTRETMQKIFFVMTVTVSVLISGRLAWNSLTGEPFRMLLRGNLVTGVIPLEIDALSGWFILIIHFVFITGLIYGLFYLKAYRDQKANLTLHYLSFILLHASLVGLCLIRNSLVFLIAWEIMTLSAFMAVIFEHNKKSTLDAGMNFLIQSHISLLFLMLGFLWVAFKTGSYDFAAISEYAAGVSPSLSLVLMFVFFAGFAIKAGFVPFHTWLPYAHPAAPAHISGIMSGVMIKIGIFGILRMILTIPTDYLSLGYFILGISAISGVYGVMLAIVQHNLKKLLAYHSVENIGIIGLGIGIGCIGLGMGHPLMTALGFAGALLHTLNHALFKSLLFFTTGTVYQATHTLEIEQLGGLIKKMPQTALLFLIASIAISGIPPFNGFISEFIIYTGFYEWLLNASVTASFLILVLILGLVLIGGLALLCFTKAFGIVFLGTPRKEFQNEIKEAPFLQLLPLYLTAALILAIGIFPQAFLGMLSAPLAVLGKVPAAVISPFPGSALVSLQTAGYAMTGFILFTVLVYFLKNRIIRNNKVSVSPTWGCGYVAPTSKLQYTAGSFVRSYRKLNSPALLTFIKEKEVTGMFPTEGHYESHTYDYLEKWLIDKPLSAIRSFMGKFHFFQNGRLQSYILYGILLILAMILFPVIVGKFVDLFRFIKQL